MSDQIRERVAKWFGGGPRVTATDHTDFHTAKNLIGGLCIALDKRDADVERLTLERDALAVEVSTLPYPSDLAEVTSDRDRLAAALAEVREAADALVECVDAIDGDALRYGLGPALDAADTVRNLASIPADLAAAHDARVRAEAFEDVACAFDCIAMMARKPGLVSRYTEAAARVRAEAERIGGGR